MKDWSVSKQIFVPVLNGTELISFTVVGVGLCFGFVLKTILIHRTIFDIAEQVLHKAKAFSAMWIMVKKKLTYRTTIL